MSNLSWLKGERAEDFVAGQLQRHGWTIAARNFRRRGFEIDIIALNPQRLLCIEVKARTSQRSTDPTALINSHKVQRLHKGMETWLQIFAPDDRRNTEFWLCLVSLPVRGGKKTAEWLRMAWE